MNETTYTSEATRLHMEALTELGQIVAALAKRLDRTEQALLAVIADESISVSTCTLVLTALAPEVTAL